MGMEHEHGIDMHRRNQYECMDMQHGHAYESWTLICGIDMDMNILHGHRHAAWICRMVMEHGHGAWIWSMNIEHEHGMTCTIDIGTQRRHGYAA